MVKCRKLGKNDIIRVFLINFLIAFLALFIIIVRGNGIFTLCLSLIHISGFRASCVISDAISQGQQRESALPAQGLSLIHISLALSLVLAYGKNIRNSRWVYIAGIAAFLFCVGMSVWMAYYEPYEGPFYPYDRFFTGRITSMNTLEGGGGILRNWSLFSRPENTKYFDMRCV